MPPTRTALTDKRGAPPSHLHITHTTWLPASRSRPLRLPPPLPVRLLCWNFLSILCSHSRGRERRQTYQRIRTIGGCSAGPILPQLLNKTKKKNEDILNGVNVRGGKIKSYLLKIKYIDILFNSNTSLIVQMYTNTELVRGNNFKKIYKLIQIEEVLVIQEF